MKRTNTINKTRNKISKSKRPTRTLTRRSTYVTPGTYAGLDGTVSIPAAFGGVAGNNARGPLPLQWGTGKTLVVTNYELVVSAVAANGAFSSGGSVLNPGLSANYPWLSTIAANYQKFRWRKLRYIYVPACSTSTAGTQWLLMNYDYDDNAPTTLKQVMLSYDAASGPAWLGCPISAELAFRKNLQIESNTFVEFDPKRQSEQWYYVRTTNNANNSSGGGLTGAPTGGIGTLAFAPGSVPDTAARPGLIYFGVDGIAGTAAIGNIYAVYECEFSNPISSALNL